MDETSVTINGIWFTAAIFALIAVVLVVIIWQVGSALRARAAVSREDAYRKLANQVGDAQARAGDDLSRLAEDVRDMKGRIIAMERMMREVD
jgi:hypothetical protein